MAQKSEIEGLFVGKSLKMGRLMEKGRLMAAAAAFALPNRPKTLNTAQ